MKRQIIYYILALSLLTILIAGATFAYFSFTVDASNKINTDTSKFGIIYSGGTHISNMTLTTSTDKSGGYSTTVSIRTADDSVEPTATIYIDIKEISANLRISGFKWEVYKNDETTTFSQGTFEGYNDTTNNIVEIVKDYQVTNQNTSFTVYFWIDGNNSDSGVIGSRFEGYIEAKTEEFKAVLE